MNEQLVVLLTYFVLAIFIGFEVISKVPTILHTPLMSGSNAIHGIILVGALLIAANAQTPVEILLGFVAVVLATINVVGGFVVTDRMLEMFKGRQSGEKVRHLSVLPTTLPRLASLRQDARRGKEQ